MGGGKRPDGGEGLAGRAKALRAKGACYLIGLWRSSGALWIWPPVKQFSVFKEVEGYKNRAVYRSTGLEFQKETRKIQRIEGMEVVSPLTLASLSSFKLCLKAQT